MHSTARALVGAAVIGAVFVSACYRPGSRSAEEEAEPASGPAPSGSAQGANAFFDCATLQECVDLCEVDDWNGCMGAYTHSDTSSPELEAKARPFLEKACKLGGGLPCTMLESGEPEPASSDDPLLKATSAPSAGAEKGPPPKR